MHSLQRGDRGGDVLRADAGQHATQMLMELVHVQFADFLGGFGQAQRHRTAVGFGCVLDHKAFDHQFVDKLRDAWCGYSQKGADAADPCGGSRGSGTMIEIPDGVDDMHVTRLHVFRQFRQRFGDAFRHPAHVDQITHVVQGQLSLPASRFHHGTLCVTNSHY